MEVRFNCKKPTELCEIMGRNKSDKGNINITKSWHNYTPFYYSLFSPIREKKLRIFELGIGSTNLAFPCNMGINGRPGASAYGWREFFPNAMIYVADIDRSILFEDDRIQSFYCDSLSKDVTLQMWSDPKLLGKFDIIIDDGLHGPNANIPFFENSVHKLADDGLFIIEDVVFDNTWQSRLSALKLKYPDYIFTPILIPNSVNKNNDNNLIVIQKKTSQPIVPVFLNDENV